MDACQLRFAFGQAHSNAHGGGTPATLLGELCHGILETMVEKRLLWDAGWSGLLGQLWAVRVGELADDIPAGVAEWGHPESWPDFQLKRARLKRMAARLRDVVLEEPADTAFVVEDKLTAADGRLQGRADLVLRRPGAHRIIDFKTGRAIDRSTGLTREGYASQLQLYAFMEFATTGEWPVSAHLFPLEGAPVAVVVDRAVSSEVASRALLLLDLYNSKVPGDQAADPTPDNCRYCPYSGICPAFWSSYNDSWSGQLLAVVGTATQVFRTSLAGTNLELTRSDGFAAETVLIRNIDPALHPIMEQIRLHSIVAAVGLRRDAVRDSYHLPPSAVLALR